MKRILALILALMTVACLFAACGDNTETTTEPTTTEPETTEPETTVAEANLATIKKLSKHENGWMQGDFHGNADSMGIYFNTFANDAPFNEDWSLRYTPTETAKLILVRDGEEYDLTNPGAQTIVKYSKTEYYLVLDKWLVGEELFPLVNGDMIIIEGGFLDPTGEWTIDFEPQYITLKGDTAKFSVDDPRVEE
ncbi:MAG: hypothetical protein J6B67_00070 [Oscillospiraceae bacterium]|nr:hypothetical protein [Oscillospiraceae bacterium]